MSTDGDYVIATCSALYLSGARLPWESIERATWKVGELRVRTNGQVEDEEYRLRLTNSGALPETIRERVAATMAISQYVRLAGTRGGVRIVGRRPPRSTTLVWQCIFDAGLNPRDPALRAQAEQLLDDIRRQTGAT